MDDSSVSGPSSVPSAHSPGPGRVDGPEGESPPEEHRTRTLETEAQVSLYLRTAEEREIFGRIFNREYPHSKIMDKAFLANIGLDTDVENAIRYVGWTDFAETLEYGLKFLTMQFLSTLKVEKLRKDVKYTFRFFDQTYTMNLEELSTALGFETRKAVTNLDKLRGYDRENFWLDISGLQPCRLPQMHQIHNPCLRVLHRWIASNLTPRADARRVLMIDLQYLYAMVHKTKVNPTEHLID